MSPAFCPVSELPSAKRARSPESESSPAPGPSQQPSRYSPALPFGLFSYGGPGAFSSAIRQGNVESSAAYGVAQPRAKRAKVVDVTKPVTGHCSSPARPPRRSAGMSRLSPAPPSSLLSYGRKNAKSRVDSSSSSGRASQPTATLPANHSATGLPPQPEREPSPARDAALATTSLPDEPPHPTTLDGPAAAAQEAREWRTYQRRSPRFVRIEHSAPVERKGWGRAARWGDKVNPLLRKAVGWREGEGRRFGEECRALEGVLEGLKWVPVGGAGPGGC